MIAYKLVHRVDVPLSSLAVEFDLESVEGYKL